MASLQLAITLSNILINMRLSWISKINFKRVVWASMYISDKKPCNKGWWFFVLANKSLYIPHNEAATSEVVCKGQCTLIYSLWRKEESPAELLISPAFFLLEGLPKVSCGLCWESGRWQKFGWWCWKWLRGKGTHRDTTALSCKRHGEESVATTPFNKEILWERGAEKLNGAEESWWKKDQAPNSFTIHVGDIFMTVVLRPHSTSEQPR